MKLKDERIIEIILWDLGLLGKYDAGVRQWKVYTAKDTTAPTREPDKLICQGKHIKAFIKRYRKGVIKMKTLVKLFLLLPLIMCLACEDVVIGECPIAVVGDTVYVIPMDIDCVDIFWSGSFAHVTVERNYEDEGYMVTFDEYTDETINKMIVTLPSGNVYVLPAIRSMGYDEISCRFDFDWCGCKSSHPSCTGALTVIPVGGNALSVELDNTCPVRGVQFTIEGCDVISVETTSRTKGFFGQFNKESGKVILVSLSGSKINPGVGSIAHITLDGGCGAVSISGVKIVY